MLLASCAGGRGGGSLASDPAVADVVPASRAVPTSAQLVGDVDLAPGLAVDGLVIGGISALGFSAADQSLLALSDAHRSHAPARMYAFDLTMSPFAVKPRGVTLLTGRFASGHEDPEGLALWQDHMLICSEGNSKSDPPHPGGLHRLDRSGAYLEAVELPPIFTDAFPNKSFEGLSASPSGRWFVLTTERGLPQDGPAPDFDRGTTVRIMRVDAERGEKTTHAYRTDPVPRPADAGQVDEADIGVSALTMLDDDRVLVLERAGVSVNGVFRNQIRIYAIDLRDAQPVDDTPLTPDAPVTEKRLLLDFDDIVDKLTTPKLDNFEGMVLGPRLPDGRRSLILASDDNFSSAQRTVFVALALTE